MVFVALLHSQLHLNAFHAYYLSQKKKGECLKGIIYLCGEKDEGLLISSADCAFAEECEIRELFYGEKESLLQQLVRNVKELLATNYLVKSQNEGVALNLILQGNGTFSPLLLRMIKRELNADFIKVVYVEEGIGTYIRSRKRWEERGLENGNILQFFMRKIKTKIGH